MHYSFKLTKAQLDYLADESYILSTKAGRPIERTFQVLGQEKGSGKLLIKLSYKGSYSYERVFLLSADGKTERFPGGFMTNPFLTK